MDLEKDKYPVIDVEGVISSGNQYDIDITLPEDNRSVIYGIIKDAYDEPVRDAVVKLIEVEKDCGKEVRKPVSHTFTDKEGEFVFGPLCPKKRYEVQVWANRVDHIKICEVCSHHGKCLKGVELDCKKTPEAKPDDCLCDNTVIELEEN